MSPSDQVARTELPPSTEVSMIVERAAVDAAIRLLNAEGVASSLFTELVEERAKIALLEARVAVLEAELAVVRTEERAMCVELCQAVVSEYGAAVDPETGPGWGAAECVKALWGLR